MFKSKISLLILIILISTMAISQKEKVQVPIKIKELGVVTSNFNNFGFVYRTGNQKRVYAFSTTFGEFSATGHGNLGSLSIGIGSRVVREKRKKLAEKFEFRHGFGMDFYTQFTRRSYGELKSRNYSLGFLYLLGANYHLKENIFLGFSFTPRIAFNMVRFIQQVEMDSIPYENITDNFGLNAGFNTSSLRFSINYRFNKNK